MLYPNDPLILPCLKESQVIFEESLVKIKRDQLQLKASAPYSYYSLVTHPFAVAILAITAEGAYVLNQEYRHPTGHVLLGCPGGYIESNEDPLTAAQRELREETGFQAQSFQVLGSAFPYAGFSAQKTIYVRALDARLTTTPLLEPAEVIRPLVMTPEELNQAITANIELDGTLCTALFFHQFYNKF